MKKDTVSGIIGNTQGVSKAINPPRNPRSLRKSFDRDQEAGRTGL